MSKLAESDLNNNPVHRAITITDEGNRLFFEAEKNGFQISFSKAQIGSGDEGKGYTPNGAEKKLKSPKGEAIDITTCSKIKTKDKNGKEKFEYIDFFLHFPGTNEETFSVCELGLFAKKEDGSDEDVLVALWSDAGNNQGQKVKGESIYLELRIKIFDKIDQKIVVAESANTDFEQLLTDKWAKYVEKGNIVEKITDSDSQCKNYDSKVKVPSMNIIGGMITRICKLESSERGYKLENDYPENFPEVFAPLNDKTDTFKIEALKPDDYNNSNLRNIRAFKFEGGELYFKGKKIKLESIKPFCDSTETTFNLKDPDAKGKFDRNKNAIANLFSNDNNKKGVFCLKFTENDSSSENPEVKLLVLTEEKFKKELENSKNTPVGITTTFIKLASYKNETKNIIKTKDIENEDLLSKYRNLKLDLSRAKGFGNFLINKFNSSYKIILDKIEKDVLYRFEVAGHLGYSKKVFGAEGKIEGTWEANDLNGKTYGETEFKQIKKWLDNVSKDDVFSFELRLNSENKIEVRSFEKIGQYANKKLTEDTDHRLEFLARNEKYRESLNTEDHRLEFLARNKKYRESLNTEDHRLEFLARNEKYRESLNTEDHRLEFLARNKKYRESLNTEDHRLEFLARNKKYRESLNTEDHRLEFLARNEKLEYQEEQVTKNTAGSGLIFHGSNYSNFLLKNPNKIGQGVIKFKKLRKGIIYNFETTGALKEGGSVGRFCFHIYLTDNTYRRNPQLEFWINHYIKVTETASFQLLLNNQNKIEIRPFKQMPWHSILGNDIGRVHLELVEPENAIKRFPLSRICKGESLTNTDFPLFYDWANNNKEIAERLGIFINNKTAIFAPDFLNDNNEDGGFFQRMVASSVGRVQQDELKSHSHSYADNKISARYGSRSYNGPYGTSANWKNTWNDENHKYTGSTGGSETRPRNIGFLPLIKVL